MTAIALKEYTLTDRATYLSLSPYLAKQLTVFKAATDKEDDPLLNPAHLLIGLKGQDRLLARQFADWAMSCRGQTIITTFEKNGQLLYSGAPPDAYGYEHCACNTSST